VQRNHFDDWDERFDFYGAYFKYLGIPRHGLEVYAFAIDDSGDRLNPNGHAGDVNRYTLGTRLHGRTGGFDYEAELDGQWGSWAADRIEAYAAALEAGYTWKERSWSPRLGLGLDWASGDRDPNDGSVETFDQLFPLGHAFLGYLDLIGRQNVRAANINLTLRPAPEKVVVQMAGHAFCLDSDQDFLYNAGARGTRRDAGGESGREVGYEFDITLAWDIGFHQTILLGYSHFWPERESRSHLCAVSLPLLTQGRPRSAFYLDEVAASMANARGKRMLFSLCTCRCMSCSRAASPASHTL
jgi:hypothetical protein